MTGSAPLFRMEGVSKRYGGVRALEIIGDVPEAFSTTVTTVVPNKELIRATLEAGQPLAFAMLHSKQKVLRVS